MKKFITLISMSAILFAAIALIACGGNAGAFDPGNNVPTRSELLGNWVLIETTHRSGQASGLMACFNSGATHRPGTNTWPGWAGGYFIAFREDGTFSEQNFWNFDLTTLNGTFTLDGQNLHLMTHMAQPTFVFVASRQISISGNTLTMTYTRSQDGIWHYRHTFARSGDAPPAGGGNFT